MKVSEITNQTVADYLRLDEVVPEITAIKKAAVEFTKSYTGLSDEELDKYEEFYIVILILCQDMYDNRAYYVDNTQLNRTVETILGMHRTNLVG